MLNKSVLVVDDEPDVRVLIASMLRKDGFSVDFANNGQEAYEKIQFAPPYGAIVLDLMMPGVNGADFLERLETLDTVPPPVVILTAASDEVIDSIDLRLVSAVLRKPNGVQELLATVHQSIRDREAEADLEQSG